MPKQVRHDIIIISMQIKTFSSKKEFITATTSFILCLKTKTIALSGGKTPEPVYEKLGSSSNIPSSFRDKLDFYQVDERYVPQNHPLSNQKMIRKTLFKNTKNPKNFHCFDTSLPIDECLKKYAKELPDYFDLCILGIGPDGHTASLFPHSEALKTTSRISHSQTNQFPIKDRLTITFPQILASKTILILLKNRPEILAQLQHPTKIPDEFPAIYLLKHPHLTIHSL